MAQTHHHHTQRRVIRLVIILSVILLAVGIPLMVLDDERLDIGQRLGLVPGENAELMAPGDGTAVLVVLPVSIVNGQQAQYTRYVAQYLVTNDQTSTTLQDLGSGQIISMPLVSSDFISSDGTGERVLFRGPDDSGETRTILVSVGDGSVDDLGGENVTPDGDALWNVPLWELYGGTCDTYSATLTYIACFKQPAMAVFLAGNWQIDLLEFGNYESSVALVRGNGFLPFFGFTPDDDWLWYQNEYGVYRIAIPADFP